MIEIYPWIVFLMSSLFVTFGLSVFLNNRRAPESRVFGLLAVSFASWGYAWYGMLIAQEYDTAFFLAKLLNIGAAFIPVFYFHWISLVLNIKHKYRLVIKSFYFLTVVLLPITLTNYYVSGVYKVFGMFYWPLAGQGYLFYIVLVYLGITGLAFVLLVKEFFKTTGDKKHQIGLIIVGSVFGFGGGLTNFPLMYGVSFPPFGILTLLVSPVILGYAATRYHLFSLKLVAAEALTFVIWVAVISQAVMAETLSGKILGGVTSVFAVVLGIFLIKSVKKEVSQREHIEKLAEDLGATNESLSVANEKLKGLDKLKSEFLSLASHQLRSPLTAIKGYTSMLAEGSYGKLEEKQKEVIGNVLVSTQSLISMVEDFLNVSKIEQGGMQYVFEPTPLAKLVSDLFAEMKITAQNNGLDFTLTMDPVDAFTINADAGKLRQVFLNLIDNSIKYTPSGFVHLSLARNKNKNTVTFSVEDTGAGISAEEKEKLFEKFKRGDGQKLNSGGSGLGLYLAREIVKAHNGRILVESEGKGKGSCFGVELGAGDNVPSI